MALLWIDGFEHYGPGAVTPVYSSPTTYDSSGVINCKYMGTYDFRHKISSNGSTGNCLYLDSTSAYMMTPLLTTNRTMIVGFAFRMAQAEADGNIPIVDFRDNNNYGETIGYRQLHINYRTTSNVTNFLIYRGNTLIGTSNAITHDNDWHYLEVKVYCDSTAGTVEIRLDEIVVYSGTGLDTQHRSNFNFYSRILFNTVSYSGAYGSYYLDDLYICDGSGTSKNDFLGTCNVETIVPTADVLSDWAPATGNDNYAMLDDILQSSSNYIESGTSTDQATFETSNVATSNAIHGVMLCADVKGGTVDGTTKYPKFLTQNGTGNIVDGANMVYADEYVGTSTDLMEEDPDGNGWTPATVNSLRIGVELV